MAVAAKSGTRSAGKGDFRVEPKAKFFLLHGDDEAALERAKWAIIETHLTQEQRQENYREFAPSAGGSGLVSILGELTAELGTVSLLPGAVRVVTLYGGSDFFEGKGGGRGGAKKKATAKATGAKSGSEILASFLDRELPTMQSVLIVLVAEDFERWRRLSTSNPIVQLAQRRGVTHQFREQGPQFAFFDALFARNTGEAIALWRDWSERTKGAPKMIYGLATQLRLLIQAKTVASGQVEQRGLTRAQYAESFMPKEPDKSVLALQPEWRRDKFLRQAANFSFQELLTAYEKLSDLQRYVIPLSTDVYVPDKELLAELWIVEFTARD